MKKYTLILTAALACAPLLSAQNSGKERVRQEIAEKQKAMRAGKVVRANRRVTVRLKNGSRMRGVVKDGKFVELADGLAFVPVDVKRPGAGLRLWYYNNTTSFIFLPYKSITKASIGEELSDAAVREIGKRIGLERRAAQKRAKAAVLAKKAEAAKRAAQKAELGKAESKTGASAVKTAAEALPELTPAQAALIAEYPPGEGWGIKKISELERRKIVVGVYPNKVERRFIEIFKTWNEAYQVHKKIEDAKAAAKAAAKPSTEPSAKPGVEPAVKPGAKPDGITPVPVGVTPLGEMPAPAASPKPLK